MKGINYNRGSEWRRWDLHIHTKNTSRNDHFTSATFDDFCVELFKKALEQKIAVIGITDYFSIENYKSVKNFINNIDTNLVLTDEEKTSIKKIFILPNVELRMLPVTDSGRLVNIHCLINPNYENSLENNFFGSVEYSGGSGRKYKMNRQGLIDLGKSLNSTLDDDDAYKKGIESFVVTHSDLQKLLDENSSFRENVIIVASNSNNDGVSAFQKHYDLFEDTDNSSLDAVRKSIYCLSDCIFSSNDEDRKYFLGLKKDDTKTVIEKCGSIKPCIHGCDAHTEDKIFKPDEKRYCWIKADPNFEGLKQIIYEPEDRVKIQESIPDEKEDYQVIDKIKFIDDNFIPEEIQINQNLTAIIGGKSTGKSILLKNIAQSIDPKEVEEKINEFNLPKYKNEVSGFKVIWRDKQENKKNETTNVNKKIIYIPQSYLNRLVDKKEDKTTIDEIIKNVLCQDENTKKAFEILNQQQKENEINISKLIEDIFFLEREANSIYEIIKNIGDKKGIETEIQKLKIEIESLKKISGMSQPEIESYNKLAKEINEYKGQIDVFTNDLQNLDLFKTKTVLVEPDFSELSKDLKELLTQEYLDIKIKFVTEWKGKVDQKIVEIEKKKNTIENNLRQKYTEISPLVNKVKESKLLNEKIEKLKVEESKLKEIDENENKLQHKRDEYKKVIETLAENVSSYYDDLFIAKSEILKQTIISGEISFDISVEFRKEYFQNNFVSEICNLKTINQFENGLLSEYLFTDNFKFKTDISKIISNVLNGKIILKVNYDRKEALRKLVQNWYIFDYKIKQNGDELSNMSPGKKSFVLLKLLIELDNSKCPILLDQPEDDLDNRSIYKDLVKFIKTKKKERQIIIVTHNPNLVVGADAECIIVANQSGENSENKTYKFEYISGSLENTFIDTTEEKTLYKQGIQEHVCDILEGGEEAFRQRKNKYNIN